MPQIAIRSAQASDRDAVLAFCNRTWDWGDYIERVWDEWLDNEQGKLLVATADQQPIGITHVQMLTDTDAWLEGLRVDPDYRRQGIARALNEAALVEAMRRNATYIRLAVDSSNTASVNLTESMLIRHIGTFSIYSAPPFPPQSRAARQQETQIASSDDLDDIIMYLNDSNIFPLVGGLYYARFKAVPITAQLLEHYIAHQQIYILRRWDRLDGLAIVETLQEMGEHRLSVGYIDGTAIEAISLIAYDLRRRLSEMELDSIRVYAPDMVLIRDAFDGVEFVSNNTTFNSYERSLI